MRVTTGLGVTTTPNGAGARPTVGLANPMTTNDERAVKQFGSRPSGIEFDSKQRLRGRMTYERVGDE